MQLKLRLVPFNSNAPRREAVAWFVRGRNPQDWLSELNGWDIPLEWLELRSIPQSFVDATPMGVLVTWPALTDNRQAATHRSLPLATHHAQPYGRIADRLFIPIDAGFFPEVDANDLLSLLPPDDSEFLWHPSAGLIRIEAIERLQIIDLLAAPPKRQTNWNCAVPGISFNSRLISVEPDAPVTPDEIFEEEASDIGSQQDSLEDLPPTPDEFLKGKLNNLTKRFRDIMKSLQSGSKPPPSKIPNETSPPGTSGTGNPLSNLAGHASSLIATAATLAGKGLGFALQPLSAAGSVAGNALSAMGISSLIDQIARNREIDRLINLLNRDPDFGLKFALSMGGGEDHRGTANPSNELGARDVGFDLNRLFGGQPADRWDIRPDQQQMLIQQYRELAAREIRLGRHRRAAYIYAELLRDLVSAAGALESGHHYREAAVLWRDKLKRPLEAARCLERAGLLDEAATLYIETGNFEKAAEIYVRLGRPDEAEQLLRNWVESLISRGDYQGACRILLDKLNDIDGALQALSFGWPSSPIALQCLKQTFEILGTNARHEQAHALVAKLKDQPFNGPITKLLARGLSESAIKYPDVAVREAAGDATRIVVSRVLKTSDRVETMELLETIRNLAPQDRLLFRDTNRYFRIRHESGKSKERSSNSYGSIKLTKSSALWLKGMTWKVAKSASDTVYVAGYGNDSLVLQRLKWNNLNDQTRRVLGPRAIETTQLILEPFPDDAGPPILHPIGIEHLRLQQWTQHEPKMFPAGSPSWGTKSTVALTYSEGGFGWRIRDIFGQLELACFSPRGEPLFSMELPIPRDLLQDRSLQITLQVVNGVLWLGHGKSLYSINSPEGLVSVSNKAKQNKSDITINELDLKSEIQSLVVRPFGGNACLIALFEIGGCVVNEHGQSLVAMDCESPVATFLSDGRLIIASGTEVCSYDIVKSRSVKKGSHRLSFKPISVTRTNKLSEFAVFGRNGEIAIFEIEAG